MGIKKLLEQIKKYSPDALVEKKVKDYSSKVIGFDASSIMYKFLNSMIQIDSYNNIGNFTDKDGNTTTHLIGLLNKVSNLLSQNILPVFVFDGKPPQLKNGELAKRRQRREKAAEKMEDAKEIGTTEDVKKQAQIQVKITREMKEDAVKMLKMFGVPVIEAPCEAEAQLVQLLKEKKIDYVASEDMDCLTFGCHSMLKSIKDKRELFLEINLDKVLKGLKFDMDQFIHFCILCGCDYTKSIKNLGPGKAYTLISEHKNIDNVLEHIKETDKKKRFVIPEDIDFKYDEAYEFFINPYVDKDMGNLKFTKPKDEEIINFLVKEKNFNIDKVKNNIERCKKANLNVRQQSLFSFFGSKPIQKKDEGLKFKKK